MKLGRLLLRATIGGFFIGHGTQKLFGWFGGQGLKDTAGWFESIGMKPGQVQATAAGVAETAGGAGLVLGFQTPFAASAVIAVMLTAINRVHLRNGPWNGNGGYEFNAVMIAGAATLAEIGPGKLSIDGLRKQDHSGSFWGLGSLVLGAIGAAGAHLFAESQSAGEVDAASEATEPPEPTETPEPTDEAPTAAETEPEAEPAGVETAE